MSSSIAKPSSFSPASVARRSAGTTRTIRAAAIAGRTAVGSRAVAPAGGDCELGMSGLCFLLSLCPGEDAAAAARLDLLLDEGDGVEPAVGRRRAARHVDVDWHDRIDALHDRVVVEHAAARGKGAPRDHPLRSEEHTSE